GFFGLVRAQRSKLLRGTRRGASALGDPVLLLRHLRHRGAARLQSHVARTLLRRLGEEHALVAALRWRFRGARSLARGVGTWLVVALGVARIRGRERASDVRRAVSDRAVVLQDGAARGR